MRLLRQFYTSLFKNFTATKKERNAFKRAKIKGAKKHLRGK